MTNQDVINFLNQVRKILLNDKSWLESTIQPINEAFDKAISALQARDSETRKICNTCKHDPPSKKWPCVDCDMREPADRWESKECQTCKHYDDASKKCGECLELGIDNYEPKPNEDSCINSIVEEIKELIVETKNSGKYHSSMIRLNGEMVCHGLQMALEIITEKSAERKDND